MDLVPHPEGGYFRQIYRSNMRVQPLADRREERAALTTIYFLLVAGDVSRWHQVLSDEVWHFYEGEPLELFSLDPEFSEVRREVLGPVGGDGQPVRVVPAHQWQAARPLGDYTLAGCSVGPGFVFDDFQMLGDLSVEAKMFRNRHPEWAFFL